jgi:hypothetical protein
MTLSKRSLWLLNILAHDQQGRRRPEPHLSEKKLAERSLQSDSNLTSSFDLDLDPDDMGL